MTTPHNGRRKNRQQHVSSETTDSKTVGPIEHYSCGLAGLLMTAAIGILLYPTLVAVTRPLHLLSSTVLLFILITIWVVAWMVFELAWEWRAGRLPVSN
jgi:uncharacterized protein YqhQ